MIEFHGTDPASVARRLAEIEEIEAYHRRARWAFARTMALIVVWTAVAILGMAWGFQMDDPKRGPEMLYLSALVGDIGIVGTLVAAYLRER